ncbi:hypothetical protein OAV92_01375 [Crocinitomicaceae bacterium]|nr:hypothetical protein [Crocinitomicaceae bacterium]
MKFSFVHILAFAHLTLLWSCKKVEIPETDWNRYDVPVFRDYIPEENYQAASDGHVFFIDDQRYMIYSGDHQGVSSIKLATSYTWIDWDTSGTLLGAVGPSGKDVEKETSFYRKRIDGVHQIYYIGYPNNETYEAEIYLAESYHIEGPYEQKDAPIIPRGTIAGKEVYCMTSPSVVEHEGLLYMCFLGWNAAPDKVTEVWTFGAISENGGATWSSFEEIDCPIGMEGQITKGPDNRFYAVSTGAYDNREAIFYAEANHPYGPWTRDSIPILTQAGKPFEKDEIIAPQITFDPATGQKYLYYTGANHKKGWWMMMATESD